ncbi:MAG TPA: glutamate--tRNA ligase family protein [Candidatus Limnocylindrales bacterium]|nr:glutamate--tRNA ligase family protein [Candidatus Limnocylindrales bacterium]
MSPTTRFAPAPTGLLHLGHVANAIHVWALARRVGGSVVLRIEDHDRERSRSTFEVALLEDVEWLGFVPDAPSSAELRSGAASSYRQSDNGPVYAEALAQLRRAVAVYACDCSRATFASWSRREGRAWSGPGCPGGCRLRNLAPADGLSLRAELGDGEERWVDRLLGARSGPVAGGGDLIVRDRNGSWTYSFAVVVDDLRHGVDIVVRGDDLVVDTPRQIRLGRLLGREVAPAFAHHPLVLRADGSKLSKSAGDTGVRELRGRGWTAADVVGAAAAAVGLVDAWRPIAASDVTALVGPRLGAPVAATR